ncbi:MAG TPA: histidine kinase [Nitrolancea sp.]
MILQAKLPRIGRWLQDHPQVEDSLFAAAIAGPFAAWSLVDIILARPPWDLSQGVATIVVLAIVVASVAFAFRRVAPAASFAVVSVALLIQTIVPNSSGVLPTLVIFPFSLFAFSAYGRRWAPALGLAVSLVGAGAITTELMLNPPSGQGHVPLVALYGTSLAVALVGWSLGLFRRVQLAYIAALEERAARAEAEREERARAAAREERTRIAREMHDVVAHSLAVIVSQAQGGRYAARSDPDRAGAVLATIAETGRQALSDMRGLLDVLRPDAPVTGDIKTDEGWTPQPTLAELPDLLERVRAAGLPVTYTASGAERPLGPAAGLAIYRLVQEALTNTLKHAGPGAEATVRFDWGEQALTAIVRDSGRGVVPSPGEGHGLIGMRERLASVGGSVTAGPLPGGGFKVEARLPWRAKSGAEVCA